jgi:hypothetical protein
MDAIVYQKSSGSKDGGPGRRQLRLFLWLRSRERGGFF